MTSEKELQHVHARQHEVRAILASEAAMIAAIKASGTYRITQMIRRFVPKAPPVLAAQPVAAVAADAAAATDPGAAALASARAELARLEAEARQVHHELHHLQLARPRRLWIAVRKRMMWFLHPVWALGAAARVAGNSRIPRSLHLVWRRFFWHEAVLRFQPPATQHTDQPNSGDALRWLAPVRISGQTRHSFLMHPNSSVTYRVQWPAGARLVADCGLLPTAWDDNRGGVEFDLDVAIPDSEVHSRGHVRVNPGDRFVDRRWRRLVVNAPPGLKAEGLVRLTTRVPAGAAGTRAAAVWGEPRIEWPRTGAEMWRSVVVLTRRIRNTGLQATMRHIRGVQASDQHAEIYRQWIERNTPTPEALKAMAAEVPSLKYRPRLSLLMPCFNTDAKWVRACLQSIVAQVYPDWELCLADDCSTNPGTLAVMKEFEGDPRIRINHLPKNVGIALATNAALEMATGEFIVMVDSDDALPPEALFEMVRVLNASPDLDFIYSDEDKLGAAGERCDPYFKPDWSPEHFLSCMYTCHLMVLRTSLVKELGGFRKEADGSQDYDIVLRVMERTSRIHHVPKILYHWRKIEGSGASTGFAKSYAIDGGERALQDHIARTGKDAVVIRGAGPGLFRVRHRIAGKPLVSIVLPTAGRSRFLGDRTIDLLTNCVGSVAQKTTYENYEIIIGDDGSLPEATEEFLRKVTVPIKRVSFPQPEGFNYGRKLNFIASHSKAPHLILFNDDTEVIAPEWIDAMLEHSQQEEIGAVGSRLLFGDGRIQHVGMVIGVNGMAAHVFHQHQGSTPGYGASAQIIRNYSSVTAACMMTRREIYERLGGFQTRFQFDFNDVDYCLRVRQEGYRVVYTPYSELYHLEWATWGTRPWHAEEVEYMQRTWAHVCEHDPYYNPNLSREHVDCRPRV